MAAHEAGHALQHLHQDALFNVRMSLAPITQLASYAWMGVIILGLFLHIAHFPLIAAAIFAVFTLFQLVTLPVEYDASARAKEQLFRLGLVNEDRTRGGQPSAACRRLDLCGRIAHHLVEPGLLPCRRA